VKVHRDVEKFLRKIPKHDAERIREKIISLKDSFELKNQEAQRRGKRLPFESW